MSDDDITIDVPALGHVKIRIPRPLVVQVIDKFVRNPEDKEFSLALIDRLRGIHKEAAGLPAIEVQKVALAQDAAIVPEGRGLAPRKDRIVKFIEQRGPNEFCLVDVVMWHETCSWQKAMEFLHKPNTVIGTSGQAIGSGYASSTRRYLHEALADIKDRGYHVRQGKSSEGRAMYAVMAPGVGAFEVVGS